MKISQHLDKVYSLGFTVNLSWNQSIEICFILDDINIVSVLFCALQSDLPVNDCRFEDLIEVCCDIFYHWYNENLYLIKKVINENSIIEIEDKCLGDVTKRVYRELNLSNLFSSDNDDEIE